MRRTMTIAGGRGRQTAGRCATRSATSTVRRPSRVRGSFPARSRTDIMRLLLVSILAGVVGAAAAQDPQPIRVATATPLFNGRTLDGWYTWTKEHRYDDPAHVFSVQDGLLRISGE